MTLFNIFYELKLNGWTLAITLVSGIGTVSTVIFALTMARRRIAELWPGLDVDSIKAEILKGNEN